MQRLKDGTPEEALQREAKLLELMEQNQRLKGKVAKADELSVQMGMVKNEYKKLRIQDKVIEVAYGLLKESVDRLESDKTVALEMASKLEDKIEQLQGTRPSTTPLGGVKKAWMEKPAVRNVPPETAHHPDSENISTSRESASHGILCTPKGQNQHSQDWRHRLIDAATPKDNHPEGKGEDTQKVRYE